MSFLVLLGQIHQPRGLLSFSQSLFSAGEGPLGDRAAAVGVAPDKG